jgi:hypothetical protein
MDEQTYKMWWPLHCRVALGETLAPEECQVYEAGLAILENEEWNEKRQAVVDWRVWQERWRELDARNQQLAQQENELRAYVAELERQYSSLTGEKIALGV